MLVQPKILTTDIGTNKTYNCILNSLVHNQFGSLAHEATQKRLAALNSNKVASVALRQTTVYL